MMAEQQEARYQDHVASAVPDSERRGWWATFATFSGWVVWPGMVAFGVTLLQGQGFWPSLAASIIGGIVLGGISTALGVIAMKYGFNTYIIGDRTFGNGGGRVIGACLAITLMGWFGVSTGASGQAFAALFPGIPYWVFAALLSAIFGGTAVVGFSLIRRLATYTIIPVCLLLVAATIYAIVANPGKDILGGSAPVVDHAISFALAVGLVITNWIMGCTTTGDILRYSKNVRNVAISQFVTFAVVFGVLNWIGVPFAIATGTFDMMGKLVTLGSLAWTIVAMIIIVFGTWTTADTQCWIASLGLTYAIGRPNLRWVIALIITAIGFVATLYIWNYIFIWVDFIGTLLPPIPAIILIEYYAIQKRSYGPLAPPVNAMAYVSWALAAALGLYTGVVLKLGIGAINSLIITAILYYILRRFVPQKSQTT